MLRHVRNLRENKILARLRLMVDENKLDRTNADETDPHANDPFFKYLAW
jgi:hypothetical protein